MNGPTHQIAGAIAALAVTQSDNNNVSTLHHPAAAIPLGAFLGRLPDILEPALRNPNHRQFFHSFIMLGLIGKGTLKAYQWNPETDFDRILRAILLIGGSAYLSHLALDALTAKSLPLVGKL